MAFEQTTTNEQAEQQLTPAQQQVQQLTQDIATLANKETDPAKAEVLPSLSAKVVDLLPEFGTLYTPEQLNMVIKETGNTVWQETFAQLQPRQAIQFNQLLDPSHPQHLQLKGRMASFFESEIANLVGKAEYQEQSSEYQEQITTVDQNIAQQHENISNENKQQEIERMKIEALKEELAKTKQSQATLKSTYGDKIRTADEMADLPADEKASLAKSY